MSDVIKELTAKIAVEMDKASIAKTEKDLARIKHRIAGLDALKEREQNLLDWAARQRDLYSRAAAAAERGQARIREAEEKTKLHREKLKESASGFASRLGIGEAVEGGAGMFGAAKTLAQGPLGVAAAGAAVLTSLAVVGEKVAKEAGEIKRSASKLGMDTNIFQEVAAGAKDSGVPLETMSALVGRLNRQLWEAGKGAKGSVKAFEDVGIKTKDAAGKIRPVQAVLMDIADKFAALPEGPERGALAMKLFGKSGLEAVPWLGKGSARLKEFADDAKKFGTIIDKETIKLATEYKDAKRDIGEALEGLEVQIGSTVLPALTYIAKGFQHWLEKMQPVMKAGLREFLGTVGAGLHLIEIALTPVTMGLDALSKTLAALNATAGGRMPLWASSIIDGVKAILNPLKETWEIIEDLQFYWAGKGSALGMSIATARGKGKEYVQGIEAGKTFDLLGNVIQPGGGPQGARGSPEGFAATGKGAAGRTMAGTSFALGLQADREGRYGEALLNYAGAAVQLPTMVPEMIGRGYAGLFGAGPKPPGAMAEVPSYTPVADNPMGLPRFAPLTGAVEVKVKVSADEGLAATADSTNRAVIASQ